MRVKVSPIADVLTMQNGGDILQLNSKITIPPSKSVSHRAIVCACLAKGKSVLTNISYSKDVLATINGMRTLGATIQMNGDSLVIEGISSFERTPQITVDCNESGSTLRFLIPIFSLLDGETTFKGQGKLMTRPQTIYEDIFSEQRGSFIHTKDSIVLNAKLKSGDYTVKGDVSSQFLTGLLFALPLLKNDSSITILPPFESGSYVDLTLQILARFGVIASIENSQISKVSRLIIKGGQQYKCCELTVEGDYSQLAFFAVIAAISGKLAITGMQPRSKQGDRIILPIIKQIGGNVENIANGLIISHGELIASDIDLGDCPDLGPVLMVLLSFCSKSGRIYNAKRLRIKESDRISCMESELKKLSVNIASNEDSITICGREKMLEPVSVFAHNDHRIAMSLAVFAACGEYPVIIEGAECVEKSYPSFFDDLRKIGVTAEII